MSWSDFNDKLDGHIRLKRWIFTVSGSLAQWYETYPADVARNVEFWYRWQGVSYPAQNIPMGPSTDQGIAEHIFLLDNAKPPEKEWVGVYYSQGAMVGTAVYKHLLATGSPHLETLKAVVTFGNPCRERGIANGNKYAGWPMPDAKSRGIATATERMTNTPDWWLDFAHPGDIYTDTPDNNVGEDMTMIYRVVQDAKNLVVGSDSAFEQIMEMLTSPLTEIPAAVIAIINGIKFLAHPVPTEPHVNYDINPAIQYLNYVAERIPIEL